MMDSNTLLIIMAILFMMTIILILIIVLNNAKKTNDLNNELSRSIFEIRANLNRDFNDFSERVNSNLIQSHKYSNEIFASIGEKMGRIDAAQRELNELSDDVLKLHDILTDKKSRGSFGEVELYALLESAYGSNEHLYGKQYHLPNGSIADAVIFGFNALDMICIDSKFPLENYRIMYDPKLDNQQKKKAAHRFRDDVRKHINDIHEKYIIPGVTADLAFMFIPAEAIFAEIYGRFSELVEYSYQQKVFIVSPTTIMAYITAIKSIYLGQKRDEKARQIEDLLAELSVEFERYAKRTEDLYHAYEVLGSSFMSLNTTSRKIIRKFENLNNGEFDEDQ